MPGYVINPETNEGEVAWEQASNLPLFSKSEDNIYLYWKALEKNYFTFYIKNNFTNLIWFNWEVQKNSSIVAHGENICVASKKASLDIKVPNLTPDTNYSIKITPWYEFVDISVPDLPVVIPIYLRVISTVVKTPKGSSTGTAPKPTLDTTNNFNFLYQYIPSAGTVTGGNFADYKVTATKIGPQNRFYHSKWSSWSGGINPYPYLMGNGQPSDPSMTDNPWLYSGSVLPNCVSYAFGRLCEVWYLCLENKFLVLEGSNDYYLCDRDTGAKIRKIEGEFSADILDGILGNRSASSWASRWHAANRAGWGIIDHPVAGAIICWDGAYPGHVAFIEEVRNAGTDSESIIISQTYYGTPLTQTQTIRQLKKSEYGAYGASYKFLVSPVCQLVAPLSVNYQNDILIELIERDIDPDDIAAYYELGHKYDVNLWKALKLNDRVEIQWFGNTKADGTGRSVGKLTLVGTITNVYNTVFPYEVTVGNKIIGYYPRASLVKTTAALSVTDRLTDNVNTNKNVLFTCVVNIPDLHIRTGPGITFPAFDYFAEQGKTYNVYDVKSNGYDWYKINKDHDQWIANKKENGVSWVTLVSAQETDIEEDYQYKVQVAVDEVHVRSTPECKDDLSNVIYPNLKLGEIVNVYLVDSDDPNSGTIYPAEGYDDKKYCWRRIGPNKWIADVSRDGVWVTSLANSGIKPPEALSDKKIQVNDWVQLNIRKGPSTTFPIYRTVQPSSPGEVLGYYYKVIQPGDLTWYCIDVRQDLWVGNKYDKEIGKEYIKFV